MKQSFLSKAGAGILLLAAALGGAAIARDAVPATPSSSAASPSAEHSSSSAPASSAHSAASALTPAEALMQLKMGNIRYIAGKMRFPRISADRRQETSENGQHPIVSIVSCADSRVPPEYIFDQGIGDVFVIRVAGNVCNTDEIGTVEYGAGHLGTPLILVMGHTKCGAVTAVAKGDKVGGSIPKLVAPILPAVETAKAKNPTLTDPKALVPAAIRENVWQSMKDLLTRSEEVRELIETGKVRLEGALYDIATGEVEWLGPHPDQKTLLTSGEGHGGAANHNAAKGDEHAAPATSATPANTHHH